MNAARRLASLVVLLAPEGYRQTFLDDLDEAHARRIRSLGPQLANAWYRRQLLASVAPFLRLRWRERRALATRPTDRRPKMTVDSTLQDVRYAIRMLWRAPSFTLAAVLTIALGIGANTAVFTIVYALLLKPLPYPEPDRLVTVWQDMRPRGGPADEWATPGNLVDWRAETSIFASMASMRGWGPVLTGHGDPEPLRGEQVTAAYFDVLRVSPAVGRTFTANDAIPNAPRVVVLGDAIWKRRFGGDSNIVGRSILLSGEPHEVIGVLPPEFRPAVNPLAELWRPDRLNLTTPSRGAIVLRVIARLQPGVDVERASSAMGAVAMRLEQLHPDTNTRTGILVIPMHERVVGNVRPALLTIFGAVVLVLLIACVNIANLLLARATGRTREMAVRAALGAGRTRVVRQLLTESVVLAAIGSLAGVLLGYWAVGALVSVAPAALPRLGEIAVDGGVLAFTAGLTLLTGLVFGVAPALQLARADLVPALKQGAWGTTAGGNRHLRRVLVIGEVAVALVLLVGGVLLVRSFQHMRQSDLGFNPDHVLVGGVVAPQARYPTEAHRLAFFDRVLARVATMPGVTRAALVSILPLSGGDTDMGFQIDGAPAPRTPEETPVTWFRLVSHDYFDAIGMRLTRGRLIQPREAEPVVIINESLASKHWPGGDPLGQRVRYGSDAAAPWFTIVGIAADVKQQGARSEPRLQTFIPYWQFPGLGGGMNVVLKTATTPESLVDPLRGAIRELDPDIPVAGVTTMSGMVASTLQEPRFLASLVGLFAALALIVAIVGVYGLMSYSVTSRRSEIGVRLALGADRSSIFGLVLRDGLLLVAIGVGIGAAVGFWLAPAIDALLFGIPATDPATYALAAATLVLVAAIATIIPARRATRVSPVGALRGE